MKKYPVIYKGKEYEVRWTQASLVGSTFYDSITIYEVKEINIFGIKIKRYKEKFSEYEHHIKELIDDILSTDPNYYIEEVKTLFKFWELCIKKEKEKQEISRAKIKSLEEWDGVIDE